MYYYKYNLENNPRFFCKNFVSTPFYSSGKEVSSKEQMMDAFLESLEHESSREKLSTILGDDEKVDRWLDKLNKTVDSSAIQHIREQKIRIGDEKKVIWNFYYYAIDRSGNIYIEPHCSTALSIYDN